MERHATLSPCGKYRYALSRVWDRDKPLMGWIMLNPSTADAEIDDATIRVCVGRARRMGFGGIRVLNLFNYRATHPTELARAADPVGPGADVALETGFGGCDYIMAAWGNHGTLKGVERPRCEEVLDLFGRAGVKLHALKLTKFSQPAHPLRIGYDVEPILWAERGMLT